jgi:hypothetical protein
MEPNRVRINDCPRCGQSHDVEVTPYRLSQKRQPYTHWYTCPVTGDPASLNLTLEGEVQLDQRVVVALAEAQATGQYMVAIWRVELGQLFRPFWLTGNFPRGDVGTAIDALRQDMAGEMVDMLPPAQLTQAFLRPLEVVSSVDVPKAADGEQDSEAAGGELLAIGSQSSTASANAPTPTLAKANILGASVQMQLDNEPPK